MKTTILFIIIQTFFLATGFTQNPPWKEDGTPIPARAVLDVRWEDSARFPRKVWIYELLPNDFSSEIISNVMVLCSFTEKDKAEQNTNGITFQSPDGSRKLSISFPSGDIHYETPEPHYSLTNLAVGVPQMSQLPELTKDVLRKLHIRSSDITGWIGRNKIEFTDGEGRMYFTGKTVITNTMSRRVYFRRTVDGMPVAPNFYGFNVGEHGKIRGISITWPNLKRIKSYPTLSRKAVINLLRKGNAIRGPAPDNAPYIDWPSIKSVTITKAVPSYLTDNTRLYPFLRLDATIDTGNGDARVAIDCPIIDETKP